MQRLSLATAERLERLLAVPIEGAGPAPVVEPRPASLPVVGGEGEVEPDGPQAGLGWLDSVLRWTEPVTVTQHTLGEE